jgi:NitT/TauT family transport system permease protein
VKRAALYRWLFLAGGVVLLEVLCLTGFISHFNMPPPHEIAADLVSMLWSGRMNATIVQSFTTIIVAFVIAMTVGIVGAAILHRMRRVREALEPFFATYYAIPVLAFYPLFIIIFGLGPVPQILVAVMFGAIAVLVTVLDGLDRVPRVLHKVARIEGLGPVESALKITLPCTVPYILTASKLAVTYSIIGIIASEFIMSGSGLGYEISFAYINFDNATMYPLILLILIVAIAVNNVLFACEKRLLAKRGMRS